VSSGRSRRVGRRNANLREIERADAVEQPTRGAQVYVYGSHAHVPDVIVQCNPATGAEVERYAVLRDLRGSVLRVVSVDDGDVAHALEYGPWGEVLVDTNPGWEPFGFAGGEYDQVTGLVRFGARDYDPAIGRWLAADPIGFAGGDTNLYAYVGGDPVGLVDVTGLQSSNGSGSGSSSDCDAVCEEARRTGQVWKWR
jgi:RHS repeat-associated protein